MENTTCEGAHASAKPLDAAVVTAYEPVGVVTCLIPSSMLQEHNNMIGEETV